MLPLTLLFSKIAPQFSVSYSLPLPLLVSRTALLSLLLSCSLSLCSSVKLRLNSLLLSCSLSRCSSEQFRLLSLALCRSLSRWPWLACRLLSRFLCLSLSLYPKLEDIINKTFRICGCRNNFRQPNCSVFNRQEKFLFLLSWLLWTFQLFMHHETRVAICFRAKKMHSQTTYRLPGNLHWHARGADGRSVYGHVITKFSEMGRFRGAPLSSRAFK